MSDINQIWKFWIDFHRSNQYQNSSKSVQGEPHLHIKKDGQKHRRMDRRTNSLTLFQSKRALLWRFQVAGKKKRCLGLHLNSQTFLLNLNQIWDFSTDFHWSSRFKFSRKSVQRETHWCIRTDLRTDGRDGRDGDNGCFSRLYKQALNLLLTNNTCRQDRCC